MCYRNENVTMNVISNINMQKKAQNRIRRKRRGAMGRTGQVNWKEESNDGLRRGVTEWTGCKARLGDEVVRICGLKCTRVHL